MVNLYARAMARVNICEEAAIIHALLQYADLMPEDVWHGSEVKRIKGALLHDIFLELIGPIGCSLISSFLDRGMSKNNAMFDTLDLLYRNSSWKPYVSSLIETEYNQPISLSIIQEYLSHKESLVELALPLLTSYKGELYPIQFDKEVYIQYPITQEFTIAGKIDLLIIHTNKIIVVDLKTGKKNIKDHLQVQLYVEMLQNKFPDREIVGQLWYISKDDSIRKTIDYGEPLLPKIHSIINKLKEIDSIEFLVKNKGKRKDCKYCKLCDIAQTELIITLPEIAEGLSKVDALPNNLLKLVGLSNENLILDKEGEKEID